MFYFLPATEIQCQATKDLFTGYEYYRQSKHPIYIQDDRQFAECAAFLALHPRSFLETSNTDSITYKTITFQRRKIEFGPSTDSPKYNVEYINFWYNAEVFREYTDYLTIQSELARQFSKEDNE